MSEELKEKERIPTVAPLPRNDKDCHCEQLEERRGNPSPPGEAGESPDRVKSHFEKLCRQAEELRREFPDFELAEALRDADFVKLTAPELGVDLRRAYYAIRHEELQSRAERRGAEAARAAFAKSLRENAARPVEGGGSGAAEIYPDYRRMSGESRQELKKQIRDAAAKGRKIFP